LVAGVLGLLILAIAGAAALVAWRSYRNIHRLVEAGTPSPVPALQASAAIPGLVEISVTTPDGITLAGWYVPSRDGANVIVTHGSNSDRIAMLAEVRLLAEAGFGVLAFDWPGMGGSTGTIRWDGQTRRALVAAIDWLAARPEVDAGRIGALGFSIGGVVLTQVASQDMRIRAVVLEAPAPDFRDFVHVASGRWGAFSEWFGRLALRDSGLLDPAYEVTALVGKLAPRPVLVIGGTEDKAVPGPSVRKIYDAAREPKALWIVDGAGHGNYAAVAAARYSARLTEFFGSNLQGR
jgi:dipeptidyl aminopeptidase/acylaminoacyl peptidase